MEIIKNRNNDTFYCNAKFQKTKPQVSEDAFKMEATIFLGDKSELTLEKLSKIIETFFVKAKRSYEIDVNTFVTNTIEEIDIIKLFIEQNLLVNGKVFSKKTIDKKTIYKHKIISDKFLIEDFAETILLATQMNSARYFQDMPANLCTTDFLTNEIENIFSKSRKVKMQILNKQDLEKLGMNLVLAVNAGSKQDAKVIVCEYNNNLASRKKIAIVGKGIIFDTGGYDLKRGKNMAGMKYDMSGAIIAAHILDAIDKLKLKVNVSIVLPITDNLVDANATLPESIVKSMNGKTVEIANTDAEGRLILADGLTYASTKLKANLLIDISTLTGSVVYALGSVYTGI
jgi:leucyl aminopeptidase